MIHLTLESLAKSIEKAKILKPKVQPMGERLYAVHGKNDVYIVRFEKHGNLPFGSCTCPAGMNNKPCYHLASAVGIHQQRMIELREERKVAKMTSLEYLEYRRKQHNEFAAKRIALIEQQYQPFEPTTFDDSWYPETAPVEDGILVGGK